jgi:hypothetical protein
LKTDIEGYKGLYFESVSNFNGNENPNGKYLFTEFEEHFKLSNNPMEIQGELKRRDICNRKYDDVKQPYWLSMNDLKSFYSDYKNLENESENDSTIKRMLEIQTFLFSSTQSQECKYAISPNK